MMHKYQEDVDLIKGMGIGHYRRGWFIRIWMRIGHAFVTYSLICSVYILSKK